MVGKVFNLGKKSPTCCNKHGDHIFPSGIIHWIREASKHFLNVFSRWGSRIEPSTASFFVYNCPLLFSIDNTLWSQVYPPELPGKSFKQRSYCNVLPYSVLCMIEASLNVVSSKKILITPKIRIPLYLDTETLYWNHCPEWNVHCTVLAGWRNWKPSFEVGINDVMSFILLDIGIGSRTRDIFDRLQQTQLLWTWQKYR